MAILFSFAYVLFIAGIALVSFFIVTSLQKYSINPQLTRPLVVVYIIVTIFLALINVMLFINIPFTELFFNNIYY